MGKIGVNLSIDVTAIEKHRLVSHTNGKTYLNMTVFIDPNNPGQYGDHGMITQDVSKEEKAQNTKGPILGNAKIFWTEGEQQQVNQAVCAQQAQAAQPVAQPQGKRMPPPQQGYTPEQMAQMPPQYQMVGQPQLPSAPQGIAPPGYAPQQQQPAQGFDDDLPF